MKYLSSEFVVELDHLLLLGLGEPPAVLRLDALGPHLGVAHLVPGVLLAQRVLPSPVRCVPRVCFAIISSTNS